MPTPVARLKHALDRKTLEGLVAAFGDPAEDVLLVYLTAGQRPDDSVGKVISLEELLHQSLEQYRGAVIAYSPIDLLSPEVATKGRDFYSLRRLMEEHKMTRSMWETRAELATFLHRQMEKGGLPGAAEEEHARAVAKIVTLALPAVLANVPRSGLVAVVPGRPLVSFLDMGNCHLVYVDPPADEEAPANTQILPLTALSQPDVLHEDDLIVSLKEVVPARHQDRRLELRSILRRNGLAEQLPETLEVLARAIYEEWEDDPEERGDALQRAYTLALERTLTGNDADDLVGVLPSDDFRRFLDEGAGLYLYRGLTERADTGDDSLLRWPFGRLVDHAAPSGFRTRAFALAAFRPMMERAGVEVVAPLGPVLHQAGHTHTLARTAWLTVRDVLAGPEAEQRDLVESPARLLPLISSSCEIYGLDDPWERWSTRYRRILKKVYETWNDVAETLIAIEHGPLHFYYGALRIWWHEMANADAGTVETRLEAMVELLGRCEGESGPVPRYPDLQEEAAELRAVCEALLQFFRDSGRPPALPSVDIGAVDVPAAIGQAADTGRPTRTPSALFHAALREYAGIVARIQRAADSEIPLETRLEDLKANLRRLKQSYHVVFTLEHEDQLLRLLYETTIERTEEMAEHLQGSAFPTVNLLTSSTTYYEVTLLTFEVKNVGRVEATSISASLAPSERFELLEKVSAQEPVSLPPGAETTVQFRVRPIIDDFLRVQLQLTYEDARATPKELRSEFRVPVESLNRGPFQEKMNPYIFGVPVLDYQHFHGRRQIIDNLMNHLAGGRPQHVLLQGARRMGKTSVLHMLRKIIADRGGETGIRNWFEVPSAWYGELDRLHPVLLDLQSIHWPDEISPTAFYKEVLKALEGAGLEADATRSLVEEPYIASVMMRRALEELLETHSDKRIALLVDEFDILEQIEEQQFYAHLRHLIQNVQGITWIIASALGLYKQVGDYESPLFNVFKIEKLKELQPAEAKRLILDPWREEEGAGRLQFVGDALDVLVDVSGGHPYFVQLLCSAVVDYANEMKTNYVLRSNVYDVVERITTERQASYEHFAYMWETAGGMAQMLLLLLLHALEPPKSNQLRDLVESELRAARVDSEWVDRAFRNSLRRLEIIGAVRLDSQFRYVFAVPLFRRLLEQRLQREGLWEEARRELLHDYRNKEEAKWSPLKQSSVSGSY